tara:strand:- start:1805 stop:2011 length:207 start_codon:yes stop_codon:yes gene_type:complete
MAKTKKKDNYSTKQDNVPHDNELRRKMIDEFIAKNAEDSEMYQEFEAVPYEGNDMVRSTAGTKGKKRS